MSVIDLIASLNAQDIRLWLEDGQLRFSAPKGGMPEKLREELQQNKAAIVEFLARNQGAQPVTIRRVDPEALQKLSHAQERIWFLCQLTPGNPAFHLPAIFDIRGRLDQNLLERVLNEIVARHTILRTAYVETESGVFQKVLKKRHQPLNCLAIPGENPSCRELLKRAGIDQAFNLERGRVIHHTLFALGEDHYRLLCTIHHIATDGWSMGLMAQEITTLYRSLSGGTATPAPDLQLQYQDYAAWQRQQVQEPAIRQQLAYWRRQLDNVLPLLLPGDHPRPPVTDSRGSSVRITLNRQLTAGLKRLARDQDATLFMVLLGIFATLLYRYTQQEDFCIGTPVAGRTSSRLEQMMGCFINMLAIRVRHQPAQSFTSFLSEVRQTIQEAFANQELPFEEVVREMAVDRSLTLTPVFQVAFSLQNMPLEEVVPLPGIEIRGITPDREAVQYDLSLTASESDGEIFAEFEYKSALFEAESVHRMADNFLRLARLILEEPATPVNTIDFVSDHDRNKQLLEWNQTTYRRNLLPGVHYYIEKQAQLSPDAIAVRHAGEELTYRALDQKANRLAHHLVQLGITRRSVVGICMDRSLDLPAALLGILKAGAAWLPFDLSYPQERLDFIASDTGIRHLVTSSSLNQWRIPPQVRRIDIDRDLATIPAAQAEKPPVIELPDRALFNVIYTSGSTGKPKGVMVSHRAIINRLLWMQETFPLTRSDRVLQKTPYSFDVSVWELFWPLLAGATLVMARPQGHKDPGYLRDLIIREGISTIHFVPSMLGVFLQTENISGCHSLRQVFCSGETLSPALANRFFAEIEGASLYNLYGPTEAAIDVSYYPCRKNDSAIPIGRPITNTRLYLLDSRRQLLPIGAIGEIYIGGDCLAEGYINNPDLTDAAFVANPLPALAEGSARLYRTGDLGRFNHLGKLHYLGRTDQQVKVRGSRVELGEIEHCLGTHPAVRDCRVLARPDRNGELRLVAYVVATGAMDIQLLRDHLAMQLPSFMIPAGFVQLEAWPLSLSGKVNLQALPDPERGDFGNRPYTAPRDAIEQAIARIWQELLHVENVGIHDNFFELGGHSLVATLIMARLQKEFGVRIPLGDLFRDPTIATLARAIRTALEEPLPALGKARPVGSDDEEITL
jgi:amino acid adenylation domain-containing protein